MRLTNGIFFWLIEIKCWYNNFYIYWYQNQYQHIRSSSICYKKESKYFSGYKNWIGSVTSQFTDFGTRNFCDFEIHNSQFYSQFTVVYMKILWIWSVFTYKSMNLKWSWIGRYDCMSDLFLNCQYFHFWLNFFRKFWENFTAFWLKMLI